MTPKQFRDLPRAERIEAIATYEAREHMIAWERQVAEKERQAKDKNQKTSNLLRGVKFSGR